MLLKRHFQKRVVLSLGLFSVALICFQCTNTPPTFKDGSWRATIQRADGEEIAFNFETKDSAGKKILYVINAGERLLVDSIVQKEDSVFIELPFFESGFKAKLLSSGDLEGSWIKHYGTAIQELPFKAEYNVAERFLTDKKPVADITGRWAAAFESGKGDTSHLVGEFVQNGSRVTGTFLDPTGDYRFLEGVVNGDSLQLSAFDGAHAFSFTAKVDNENKISGGKFYSGAKGLSNWSAVKDANAVLQEGDSETKLKPGESTFNFSFRELTNGKQVSINDERFKNKVVVVQILGSWCPNCMDETKFLSEYYDQNHSKGVEVVGLAYERTTDFAESQKELEPFKNRFKVNYPILITGVTVSDSMLTEKTLPQLNKISAFPTTIFLDKKGVVREIHRGFNGPATGAHYVEFQKQFNDTIDKLLTE